MKRKDKLILLVAAVVSALTIGMTASATECPLKVGDKCPWDANSTVDAVIEDPGFDGYVVCYSTNNP